LEPKKKKNNYEEEKKIDYECAFTGAYGVILNAALPLGWCQQEVEDVRAATRCRLTPA
jgi:hypothetical protein